MGHRHIDWIGICGETRLVSDPSPVLSPSAHFYIHRFAPGADGTLSLLEPQCVEPVITPCDETG
jgi:hypothetical protein